MLKLRIKNVDILPLIMIIVIVSIIILNELNLNHSIELTYGFQYIGYLVPIIFSLCVINYMKKIQNPQGVNLSDLTSTEDIRTPTFKYGGFVNQGNNISFVKFYFSHEEIYMYYRNFFPIKIYYGPFTIDKRGCVSFSNFIIREFKKTSNTEGKISIASQSGATYYTFYMRNISKKDFELLNKFFEI